MLYMYVGLFCHDVRNKLKILLLSLWSIENFYLYPSSFICPYFVPSMELCLVTLALKCPICHFYK